MLIAWMVAAETGRAAGAPEPPGAVAKGLVSSPAREEWEFDMAVAALRKKEAAEGF
jgi:hypothetical protein